jgi:NAD(P)-dependent dehydrogenase (short-subunit alcohol dehydrogenase family)
MVTNVMSGRLSGKKALIYGGGTGIGLACAEALVREGAAICISGRRETVLQEAVGELQKWGAAFYEAGDATCESDVQRVTSMAVKSLGGLDTIIISAGAGGRTPIFDTDPAEFQRIIDNNLRSAFLPMRFAAEHLVSAGRASVIIVSSTFGLVGYPERAAYCAAKAGVIGLARSAALDFAEKGVRVNAICPGYVETPLALEVAGREPDPQAHLEIRRTMHPVPRAGRLDEMGELAVYLASDLAAFVTGQAIAIDGGYSTR